jgi:hypothetical protein
MRHSGKRKIRRAVKLLVMCKIFFKHTYALGKHLIQRGGKDAWLRLDYFFSGRFYLSSDIAE